MPGLQGDLKLRNGFHNENDDDIEFTIDGVFIEDLGRVLAFATTTDPAMTQPLETAEYEQQSPAYRSQFKSQPSGLQRSLAVWHPPFSLLADPTPTHQDFPRLSHRGS